jgi:hypothetical protein
MSKVQDHYHFKFDDAPDKQTQGCRGSVAKKKNVQQTPLAEEYILTECLPFSTVETKSFRGLRWASEYWSKMDNK